MKFNNLLGKVYQTGEVIFRKGDAADCMFVIQEGQVEVTLGSVTHRLAEDDCLAMRLDQPTAFRNRTRKPARYVVVVTTERARAGRR